MCYKSLLKIMLLSLYLVVLFKISPSCIGADTPFDDEFLIGTDDIINIQVWDNVDLNCVVDVSKVGEFTFPLNGKVETAGLTVFDLEKSHKKRLADGYSVKPEVAVSIQQYKNQKVFLLGEIKKPGSYFLKRN